MNNEVARTFKFNNVLDLLHEEMILIKTVVCKLHLIFICANKEVSILVQVQ